MNISIINSVCCKTSICLLMAIILSFHLANISWSSDQRVDEAFSQFIEGNVEKAEKLLRQEIEENPQDGLAHLLLAFCFLKQGNEEKADVQFNRAFKIGKDDPRMHNFMGRYYEATEEYEAAANAYAMTVELSPQDIQAHIDLSNIYVYHTGDYDRAKRILKKCLRLKPSKKNKIKIYTMLAAASEDANATIKYCEKILALDPDNPDAKTGIKFAKMGQEYAPNIAISSEAQEHYIRAETLFNETNFEEAIKSYSKVIELEPKFAKAYLYLGDCYFRMKQYDRALPYFKKATRIDPQNPQAWAFRGDACVYMGDLQSGRNCYRKAVDIDPEYHNAVAKLEWVEKMMKPEQQ